MLDQARLRELIRNGENSFVEFKDDAVANDKFAREIVAFANFRGGYLFLGVNDAGNITGLSRSDNEERLMNLCTDLISPPLALSYYEMAVNEKKVAVIEIENGHNKPYAVRETISTDGKKKKIQTYYQRYGSTSREITTRDELQRLFQASANIQHRDYIIAGSRIRVNVFENRIEIRSPGGIPNSLSLEKIKLGLTYHRNPVLMQFFSDARLSERLGRGIPSIFRQMKDNGNPEPVLEDLENEFRLILYKKSAA